MRPLKIALLALACLLAGFGSAEAGKFSLGGVFGAGFYSGGSFNDSLSANGYKKVSRGWEYGGSVRYGVSPRLALDLGVLSINGKGTTKSLTPKFQAEVNGIAIPLSLYYGLGTSGHASFFVGAGPMLKTGWSVAQDPVEVASVNKTAFYGQAGLEGQWPVGGSLALTASALGRIAKAKEVADSTDPAAKFDVSMNGFAVNAGARVSF